MQKKYKTKISQEIERYLVLQEGKSFCVTDVYNYLEEHNIQANLATVYRNLDRLAIQNVLIKFKTANMDTYSYRIAREACNCHEHLHMQCKVCKKIVHLEGDFMNEILKNLENQYGFVLECDNSSLSGICQECRVLN